MNNLFGSENKRENQKIFAEDIVFYEGNNFETHLRLEMCDECGWSWINLNMWFESRGNLEESSESIDYEPGSKRKFESLSHEDFKKETTTRVDKIKSQIAEGDYQSAVNSMQELRILTESWNEKANYVWKEFEEKYKMDWGSMAQEESEQCSKTYCWIKKEQERRIAEQELRNANYQDRKEFYLNLFSNYEKKEYYYEQIEFEKRLVEEFKEFGKEICDNGKDDNENEQTDCDDEQCGGKICGREKFTLNDTNETREIETDLFCIASECKAKEEISEEREAVCGNHICENGEQENCAEDCSVCQEFSPLECTGVLMFSGRNESGCPLPPICLAENSSCVHNEDCLQPLCGRSECVSGTCQLFALEECREAECIDGQDKIINCNSGEQIISEKCIDGMWRAIQANCRLGENMTEEVVETPLIREDCVVKADCGGENDVCSNGRCVTIPEAIRVEPEFAPIIREEERPMAEETIEQPGTETEIEQPEPPSSTQEPNEPAQTESSSAESPSATGRVIKNIITKIITIFVGRITGHDVEDESAPQESQEPQEPQEAAPSSESPSDEPP